MYIPLFSSVYSRYQGVRDDAPRLISLDEAFAGVDDSNIRDMFELMEHLGFDYIINSQILWGDYDTVPELSICELIRPKNADHVTVIRYLWDGKVRSLLTTGGIGVKTKCQRTKCSFFGSRKVMSAFLLQFMTAIAR